MVDQAERLTCKKTARQIVFVAAVVVVVQAERLRRYVVPQASR